MRHFADNVVDGAAGAGQRRGLRRHAEQVLKLAAHLGRQDRLLIQQVYEHGLSIADIASLSGGREEAVRRRIIRVLRRLRGSRFKQMVLLGPLLPDRPRQVATLVWLEGLSLRAAAARLKQSLHHTRRDLLLARRLLQDAATTSADTAHPYVG